MHRDVWIGDYYWAACRAQTDRERASLRSRLKTIRGWGISCLSIFPAAFFLAFLGGVIPFPPLMIIGYCLAPFGFIGLAGVLYLWRFEKVHRDDLADGRVFRFMLPGFELDEEQASLEVLPQSWLMLYREGSPVRKAKYLKPTANVVVEDVESEADLPRRVEFSELDGKGVGVRLLTGLELRELGLLATFSGNEGLMQAVLSTGFGGLAGMIVWGAQLPELFHLIELPFLVFSVYKLYRFAWCKRLAAKLGRDLRTARVEQHLSDDRTKDGEPIYMEILPNSGLLWRFGDIPGVIRRAGPLKG